MMHVDCLLKIKNSWELIAIFINIATQHYFI